MKLNAKKDNNIKRFVPFIIIATKEVNIINKLTVSKAFFI